MKLILMALIAPALCFGVPTEWFDIEHVRMHQIGDIEGFYILEWNSTYWIQVELLDNQLGDGDVASNQLIDECQRD
jgi:hypothetical protein